jgi:hypothetical protein
MSWTVLYLSARDNRHINNMWNPSVVWRQQSKGGHGPDLLGILKDLRLRKRYDSHACNRLNFGAAGQGWVSARTAILCTRPHIPI